MCALSAAEVFFIHVVVLRRRRRLWLIETLRLGLVLGLTNNMIVSQTYTSIYKFFFDMSCTWVSAFFRALGVYVDAVGEIRV